MNVAVNTDAARLGQYVSDFSIFMMAYFVDDYDEGYAVTQTETFKNWEKELEEKHGVKVLSFTFYDGPRHFMTNKEIHAPEDLKGQRIRTIGQEVCTESLSAMGATPISMSGARCITASSPRPSTAVRPRIPLLSRPRSMKYAIPSPRRAISS